jgi:ribosome biogenesis GTPase
MGDARNEHKEVSAEFTGKLIYSIKEPQELPCLGDWVLVQYYDSSQLAIIHQVLPKRSYLRRKSTGKKS